MQVLLKCLGGVKMASFWVNFAQYLEIVSLIHSSSFLLTADKDDDFDSDTVGFTFAFKMPRGQFFVDVKENGNIRAGVNVNGESGVTYENCKLNMKDINDD